MTPAITKYSQQNEQEYILEATKHIQEGTVLDIGAWDPFTFSNSRALIELGWRAILVEPSPAPLVKLVAEYGKNPKIRIIAGLAALQAQYEEIQVTDDAVSTTNQAEYDKWKNTAKFNGALTYHAIPIRWLIESSFADFVNIDAEGSSPELFKAVMTLCQTAEATQRAHFKVPCCICVEHNDRMKELMKSAFSVGYQVTHFNDTNIIFQR